MITNFDNLDTRFLELCTIFCEVEATLLLEFLVLELDFALVRQQIVWLALPGDRPTDDADYDLTWRSVPQIFALELQGGWLDEDLHVDVLLNKTLQCLHSL